MKKTILVFVVLIMIMGSSANAFQISDEQLQHLKGIIDGRVEFGLEISKIHLMFTPRHEIPLFSNNPGIDALANAKANEILIQRLKAKYGAGFEVYPESGYVVLPVSIKNGIVYFKASNWKIYEALVVKPTHQILWSFYDDANYKINKICQQVKGASGFTYVCYDLDVKTGQVINVELPYLSAKIENILAREKTKSKTKKTGKYLTTDKGSLDSTTQSEMQNTSIQRKANQFSLSQNMMINLVDEYLSSFNGKQSDVVICLTTHKECQNDIISFVENKYSQKSSKPTKKERR